MGGTEFHSLSLTQRRKDSPEGTQNKAKLVKVEMQVLTGFCISLLAQESQELPTSED